MDVEVQLSSKKFRGCLLPLARVFWSSRLGFPPVTSPCESVSMAKFQVELAGEWKDYVKDEDKILKRAFLAGFPNCKFTLRGATYEYNFLRMVQKNLTSGKERKIRAPHKWRQPARPIVPKGPTICIIVPPGAPGKTIQIDHPRAKGAKVNVAVPPTAKVGQAMLVPVPDVAVGSVVSVTAGVFGSAKGKGSGKGKGKGKGGRGAGSAGAPAVAPAAGASKKKEGWSTGAKVAAVGVGAAAVAGGVLAADAVTDGATGEMLADGAEDAVEWTEGAAEDAAEWTEGAAEDAVEWTEEAAEDVGDWIEDAGIADAAEDAAEWLGDAAEDVGDLIMDLF
ncbi:putative conserved tandem protein 4 [Amphidinium carterae]